jgi:hypothetical protein
MLVEGSDCHVSTTCLGIKLSLDICAYPEIATSTKSAETKAMNFLLIIFMNLFNVIMQYKHIFHDLV